MSEEVRRVALVEDDEDLRASTAQLLTLADFTVDCFAAAEPALAAIDEHYPGVVVTDVRMPHMSGIELFRTLQARDADLPVVLVTGHGDVPMAVDALKAGAWDFMAKPFDPEMLVAAVTRAATARSLVLDNRRLRMLADSEEGAGLVGRSPAIKRLREMIPMLADANIDLFIEGESGTGKELLARLIHRAGKRSRHRFLSVACGAVPDAVIETGLFASVGEGSIAGASRGTLFLDDLDQASRTLQSRLVPLVEQRALQPSGGRVAIPLDLRVIAAAGDAGEEGPSAILPALFYRLATLRLRMPPLRERREDVPLLFVHLAGISAARLRREVPPITVEVRDRLATHDWPGNVRELAHFADRFVLGLDRATAPAGVADAPLT
ncbi:MAG: sigma-54 dependent transcriptional regulator, partial [Sphingobium sp.]